ncbi:MAG: GEVED domain-containing protein [Vicingaceae bacterium]|nr:GEVED domain-containing protein [Vicingaceae bacterium]
MNQIYKITLLFCIVFGWHKIGFSAPVPASCSPATLNYCCSFGITNITFNTINNTSNDGADGYSDFTAFSTTVLEGQTYSLSIQTTAPNSSNQNYAGWIDFNNDGILDDVTERVFTVTSQLNTITNITIPTGAVLNTDLRLRIAADFDLSAAPTPCGNIDRGQMEDYTIVITANPNPPIAAFSTSDTLSCDGNVCFTDESLNSPTSWLWYFGDGTTSFQQNPCHSYAADGTYTVSLIATNANGSDSDTIVDYITVNLGGQVAAINCTPATTSYCCGYGITAVNFADINNVTLDGVEGYQDFSCTNTTIVTEGTSYLFDVTTGMNNAQDVRVWIDYDNDGDFNNNDELVMDAPNSFNPSNNIAVPVGATLNTPLRVRVSADIVGTTQSACDDNDRGQTEDYSIIINEANSVNESVGIESQFILYPNPANEVVYLKNLTKEENITHLAIYNSIGKQVFYSTALDMKLNKINVAKYEKGMYSLRVVTSKEILIKKFIVF